MALKLSMNQRSEDCAWLNAPAAIIRPPKETLPLKYRGAATSMGATMRDPAETGGDPGEIGMAPDDAARRREHIVEMQLDAAFLVRLPLGQ